MRGVVVTCRNPAYLGSSDFGKLSTSDFNINIRGLQAPALKGSTIFLARSGSACPCPGLPWTSMDVGKQYQGTASRGREQPTVRTDFFRKPLGLFCQTLLKLSL